MGNVIHIGPISRTVADGALMLSIMAGPDDRDRHPLPSGDVDWMDSLRGPTSRGRKLPIVQIGDTRRSILVRETVGKAVKVFERDLGCLVEEANPGWPDLFSRFGQC